MSGEELRRIALLANRGHFAPGDPALQRRTLLDGEAVEREVLGLEGQAEGQVALPVAIERCWQSEDEVERNIRDPRLPERLDRRRNLLGRMGPVHPPQH